MDALGTLIGSRTVLIDLANSGPALVVLLEFKRRVNNVQWSPRAWRAILGYRPWPPPVYVEKPDFWLGGVEDRPPDGELVFQGGRISSDQVALAEMSARSAPPSIRDLRVGAP